MDRFDRKLATMTCVKWKETATDEILKTYWLTNYEVGDPGMVVNRLAIYRRADCGTPELFEIVALAQWSRKALRLIAAT